MFMYSYCYVCSVLGIVSLCCSVYCLCVNVYSTIATKLNQNAVNKHIISCHTSQKSDFVQYLAVTDDICTRIRMKAEPSVLHSVLNRNSLVCQELPSFLPVVWEGGGGNLCFRINYVSYYSFNTFVRRRLWTGTLLNRQAFVKILYKNTRNVLINLHPAFWWKQVIINTECKILLQENKMVRVSRNA
jgi:hypothetical protein